MLEQIETTINQIEQLIKEQLPESKYQFELHDLITNTKHFRGYNEPFHWGSVYKLFVVAEIIKMSEEGLLKLDDELLLHKEKFTHGNGVVKYLKHTNKLTYYDACKMVMAVSDNLCADELLNIVGFERLNKLFLKANCHSSYLTVNLDAMVKFIFKDIIDNIETIQYHNDKYFSLFDKSLQSLLVNNYTNAPDINHCFYYVMNGYFNNESKIIFNDLLLTPNVHTRIGAYTFFDKVLLRGKTGALGFGISNSEICAVIDRHNLNTLGYFSIFTKENRKRNFQSNDTIGLIGLEITKLYEQINEASSKK